MPSYMGMHLQIRGLASVCQPGEEERSRIRESSRPAAPSSVSLCLPLSWVIPASPSASAEQGRERSGGWGGWEVLRGLRQTWIGEQNTSSSYMSDCSRWTCYCWSLGPPPGLSPSMCVSVCMRFFCVRLSAGSTLLASTFTNCLVCRWL